MEMHRLWQMTDDLRTEKDGQDGRRFTRVHQRVDGWHRTRHAPLLWLKKYLMRMFQHEHVHSEIVSYLFLSAHPSFRDDR